MDNLFPNDLSMIFYVEKFYDLFQQLKKTITSKHDISEREYFLNKLVEKHPEYIVDLNDIKSKECYLLVKDSTNISTITGETYGTIPGGGMLSIQTKILRKSDIAWKANISGFIVEQDRYIFAGYCLIERHELKGKLVKFKDAVHYLEEYLKLKLRVCT